MTLLHSERPKLYTILAFLSAIELKSLSVNKDLKKMPVLKQWTKSGTRVGVDDCSVTEHGWWHPPYQTSKTVGQMHSDECAQPWFHTAEPLGEHLHENWNLPTVLLCLLVMITLTIGVFMNETCKKYTDLQNLLISISHKFILLKDSLMYYLFLSAKNQMTKLTSAKFEKKIVLSKLHHIENRKF